jgi:predicted nucleotide-binding protein (sugar kinase/HSP70/actin superfamily)
MAHLVTANVDFSAHQARPLKLPLHRLWPDIRRRELHHLADRLGVSHRRMDAADGAARAAQEAFYRALQQRGRAALAELPADRVAAVVVGRPYNTCDPGACQDLPRKLRRLGILPIPMDMLPTPGVGLPDQYGEMYWRSGQTILSAAQVIRDDPRLQAIYVTSFGCGPDSFLLSFFRRVLGSKPFLELELDEHTADAGVLTRCEAFFESLRTRSMGAA